MKILNFTFCFLALTLASLSMSAQVFTTAEGYESNRDSEGKIVRGPYLTNKWKDNWYIGLGGGVQTSFSRVAKPAIQPLGEIYIEKWFTPTVGARIGYQGFSSKEPFKEGHAYGYNALGNHAVWMESWEDNTLSFGKSYLHGDVFLNVVNLFGGYKRDRVWTVSPYVNAGFIMLYSQPWKFVQSFFKDQHRDIELAAGVGLLNSFRLSDRLALTLDIMEYNMDGRYHCEEGGIVANVSASLGLKYNVYQTYWNRVGSIEDKLANAEKAVDDAKQALADAEAAKADLEARNKQLTDANKLLAEGAGDKANGNQELLARLNRAQGHLESVDGRVAGLDGDNFDTIRNQVAVLSGETNALVDQISQLPAEEGAALEGEVVVLESKVKELESSIKDLGDQTVSVTTVEFERRVANAEQVVYFDIDKSTLRYSESFHLDNYVTKVLAEDPDHVFYITGSADKGTGAMWRNNILSRERAQCVKKILMDKYNVPEDNVIIKATIVTDKSSNGALDRCVLIEKN